jgi:hypothetical protein
VQAKLALVDLYLAAAKPDEALKIANQAALTAPRNLEALAASARSVTWPWANRQRRR